MISRWFAGAVIALCLAVVISGCVETEVKRTTKRVDASKAEISVTDPSKPHFRMTLSAGSAEQNHQLASMLRLDIDDGASQYAITGEAFAPADDSVGAVSVAPWVNVPDSGELRFRFALVDMDGVNVISDAVTVPLSGNSFYRFSLGIFDHDPCEPADVAERCRSYTLPRALQESESDVLALQWDSDVLGVDTASP